MSIRPSFCYLSVTQHASPPAPSYASSSTCPPRRYNSTCSTGAEAVDPMPDLCEHRAKGVQLTLPPGHQSPAKSLLPLLLLPWLCSTVRYTFRLRGAHPLSRYGRNTTNSGSASDTLGGSLQHHFGFQIIGPNLHGLAARYKEDYVN